MAKKKTATRQTIKRDITNPEPHLESGYEHNPSDDFNIPGAGIEDADVALFNLFDRDIGFTTRNIEGANGKVAIKKPFVIFATGERFALTKRLSPPRDRNRKLMLPAVSIRRTAFTQTVDDITGRGINQSTGNLTVKRRLDSSDRDYQKLINKLGLQNLQELPKGNNRTSNQRTQGANKRDAEIAQGGLLYSTLGDNVWEIITIPQPQFFTTTYEVVFWTNYAQHMNYLIETYVSSFLPQVRGHQLVTDKGYWFMAYTDDNFTSNENFDDFADEERVIRYTFNVNVKGYILTPNYETNMVPIRREVILPTNIAFDSWGARDVFPKSHFDRVKSLRNEDKYVLTDIERDPAEKQAPTTNQKFVAEKDVFDPKTGQMVTKIVSILESNQKKGETVFYASDLETLESFIKNLGSR